MAKRPAKDVAPKRLHAFFYVSVAGNEPVRDFLVQLNNEDRKAIGEDIATVEFGWPVGMPTCRPMSDGLWEVRTKISNKRASRVLFCVRDGQMILLHGFIKKTQTTPKSDLDLAKDRKREVDNG